MDENKLSNLFDYATNIRGMVINQTIMLERGIDEYLCNHFCTQAEQRIEIMDLVFGNERMNFEGKRVIFRILTDKYDNVFNGITPNIHNDILYIIQQRNIIAHYLLDTTENGINEIEHGCISFIKFKNERTIIKYTFQQIADLLKKLDDCIDNINALNNFIRGI